MAKATSSRLRAAQKAASITELGKGADPIRQELLRLSAMREGQVDVENILQALVPAAAAACSAGHLVSLSTSRDKRAVVLRVRSGEDWIDWYCNDADFAEEVAAGIVAAFNA